MDNKKWGVEMGEGGGEDWSNGEEWGKRQKTVLEQQKNI